MRLSKKQEKEILQVYDTWMHSYLNGDVKTYDSYLDTNYHFIGSTSNEEFLNKEATTHFFKTTADQLAGKTEIRNSVKTIEEIDGLIFITDCFDAYFLNNNDWTYYGRFRFSSALHKNKDGWRFVYQHFSTPDSKAEKGETIGYEQISSENLQLREAIKRRTVELEHKNKELAIEAALERVRARTMAMQRSEELAETSSLLFQQLKTLGINTYSSGFTIWDKAQNELISWMCNADGSINPPFRMPLTENTWHFDQYKNWKEGKEFATKDFTGEEMEAHFRYLQSFPLLDEAFKRSIAAGHPMPKRQVHHVANFSQGNLLFITLEPRPEAHDVFKRFAKVFEQTYTRFLDLKKAEAQVGEAKIETALEKVRSRTMGMQSSKELPEVANLLFLEIQALGVPSWSSGLNILAEDKKTAAAWMSSEGTLQEPFRLRLFGEASFDEMGDFVLSGETMLVQELDGKALKELYGHMMSFPDLQPTFEAIEEKGLSLPEYQINHLCKFSHGFLLFITYEPVPDAHDIFKRFTKVFEQTYTRFLDLQKAEEQAKEAQIELGLERVRARTMAMKHSEELADTASVLFQQIKNLGFETWSCGFCIWTENDQVEAWMGADSGGLLPPMLLPYKKEKTHREIYESFKNGEASHVRVWKGAALREHYEFMQTLPSIKKAFDVLKNSGLQLPTYQCYYVGFFKYGYLLLITTKTNDELKDLSIRFAKVFEQTYTRFLDLQKAEAQTRESEIELALERVRSRSMAMQKSEELKEVIQLVYEQFVHLNIKVEHTGFIMDYKTRDDMYIWLADKHEVPSQITIPYFDSPHWNSFNEAKEKGIDFFANLLSFEEKNKFYRDLFKLIPGVPQETVEYYFDCPGLAGSTVLLDNVGLYIENFSGIPYTDKENNTLMRFGKVFQQTYTRFLDLQKAEAQARESEIELALERVRARTMAMQHSDELQEAAVLMFGQIENLGVPLFGCGFNIWDKDRKAATSWMAGKDRLQPSFKTSSSKDIFSRIHAAAQKRESLFVEEQAGKELKAHYKYMVSIPEFKEVAEKMATTGVSLPKFQIMHCAFFSQGYLMFITHEPCPEAYDIFKRFAKVYEQTYTRFLDLQKAEAQAREAQIEAALEKVRSRSLAMHKSEELGEVITVVVEKLKELDFSVDDGVALITFTEGSKDLTEWMENPGFISAINFHLPYFNHPVLNVLWEAKEKGEEFLYTRFNAEENKSFLNHIFEYSDFKHTPQDVKEFCLAAETYATSIALQKNTGIFINDYSGKSLTAKEIDILKRFSKVFEQTYTRFLDLQKAEAQGREAQIELALERVRARSMAMQSSDELVQASDVMYEELSKLDIKTIRIGICTMDAKTGAAEVWSRAEKDKRSGNHILGVVPKGTHPVFDNMVKAWKANKPFYSNTRTGGEVREYYEKLAEHLSYPLSKKYNDKETITTFFFREGSLNVVSTDPLQEADSGVMLRFAKVFEQTYTRFLDLQKAEAQARESQIQLALERVRARSMAMHKSEELAALSFELVKQIQALGVATWFCAFNIYDEDQKGSLEWGSNAEGTYPSYRTPREGIFLRYYEAGQNGETLLINEIGEDECPAHYEYLCSLPGVGEQLLKMRDSGISFPNSQIDHVAYFKYGYIIFITFEPVPEAHDIFKRFAKIFEQTYTRFLDLQKAEEQAKVAVKQASLDRVRGEIASMRSAQDLERITPLIWNELNILGIPFIRCGVFIVHEKKENVEVYLSSSKGQSLAVLHLPFGSNDLTIQSVDAWRKGKVYIQHWNKEDFLNWSKSMMAQGQIQDQETYQGTNAPPESLDLHFVPFTQGMLYVGSPYSLNEEEIDLVKSLAEAFEIAYARYEDFVKLEKAKESIEVTLNELKATQAQLIQSEKLASLGQLTAGIAHEIKNPLNFVNNFSDLSIDLIEEVFEELDKTKDQENNEEIRELLTVVKSNLEKIHQHGTRADGIVKSMLQHSRGGNGKMELTDLNILVKEYVNLSFHGMRASKNPINVSLKFDLDTQLSPVKLISEEFSRVVLNLCNNAFDAMREKTKTDKNYQPVLTLKTEEIENHILLSVADNGPGIPEGIKDKILQPFFTTKKGTEGTGLGLSLSYDIVKTHGAELKVETKLGDGTEFMILLPI